MYTLIYFNIVERRGMPVSERSEEKYDDDNSIFDINFRYELLWW